MANSFLKASLTFTSRHSFPVDSVTIHVDSLHEEAPIRKAITFLTPRVWRRCSRVLADVFVVPVETSYHPAKKLGLLNQEMTGDSVHAALAIFELGLLGWHCLVAGMDQTAEHADLSDRLTLRASRKFCIGLLQRMGEESQWETMNSEYLAREDFLANSRVAKVGFMLKRVPR